MTIGWAAYALIYFLLGSMALGAWSAAPWVPTKKDQRRRLLAEVPLAPGAKVYDLGCGDGTVLFSLADRDPGVRAIGYELGLLPLAIGWSRKLLGGRKYRGVSLRWRDLFGRDLSDADAVFVFLLKHSYPRVTAKLAKELRDDATVIVEAWPFPGVAPTRTIAGDDKLLPMYLYSGAAIRAAAARA